MNKNSAGYTVGFAVAICLVCSVVVSVAAVSLKPIQEENKVLDRQKKVLTVAKLIEDGAAPEKAEVTELFNTRIRAKLVTLATGEYDASIPVETFEQLKASKDPATSSEAPPNKAKVARVPNHALVYQLVEGDKVLMTILPIEGKGLWSTLYGFLALDVDGRTIKGITFYQHGETPGLGGEVDNVRWKALWPGRKAFDPEWKVKIEVIKGQAGPVADDPYRVDGLSGATITARGVSDLVQFWLGSADGTTGFGPYLKKLRAGGSK